MIPNGNSTYWRERADEARAHADAMLSADGKTWMMEIARLYDKLAKRAAKTEAADRKGK